MSVAKKRGFTRYVAIGDSSTEGLNDFDDEGGYRGWSRRLAERLRDVQGDLAYENLGVRGLTTRQILDTQLEPALAFRPDLVTLFSGTNDAIGRDFDPAAIERDVEHMHRSLIDGGAVVLTFTLPDLTPIMPIARWIAPRIRAMNEAVRTAATRSGATLLDFAAYPVATDPRIWHADRIHANALGHERIAAALADAISLPGSDDAWKRALPEQPAPSMAGRLKDEVLWTGRYLLPWIIRGARGRLSGSRRRKQLRIRQEAP